MRGTGSGVLPWTLCPAGHGRGKVTGARKVEEAGAGRGVGVMSDWGGAWLDPSAPHLPAPAVWAPGLTFRGKERRGSGAGGWAAGSLSCWLPCSAEGALLLQGCGWGLPTSWGAGSSGQLVAVTGNPGQAARPGRAVYGVASMEVCGRDQRSLWGAGGHGGPCAG